MKRDVYDIPVNGVTLEGELAVPESPQGVVIFAHGSGSSRHSPRNNAVAETLREAGLATLLFDLLTEEEDRNRQNRFDIDRLAERLVAATDWTIQQEPVAPLDVGYFGASTGAAAALEAAVERESVVETVVSRGGRVDMADEVFDALSVPCLFIVGGADEPVLAYNRSAAEQIAAPVDIEVVEGAGHLFEGPGELERVAETAADWFAARLGD